MRAITVAIAAGVLLGGCVESKRPVVVPITLPPAEERKEAQRLSDMLMANWSQCHFTKAKELARTDLPAPEAVREAFARCDKERDEWVRAQGNNIRNQAEYAASLAETGSYSIFLGYIQDIRANKANATHESRARDKEKLAATFRASGREEPTSVTLDRNVDAMHSWSDCLVKKEATVAHADLPVEKAVERALAACASARAAYARILIEMGEPSERIISDSEDRLRITVAKRIRDLRERSGVAKSETR